MTIKKSFTKTFKSEYFLGGTCKVQLRSNLLIIIFGDGKRKTFNTHSVGFRSDLLFYLECESSSFQGGKVVEFIDKKMFKATLNGR